ncbi:hypothetical protein ACIFQM_20835 [Paenibacillus sp. NRS-1782]
MNTRKAVFSFLLLIFYIPICMLLWFSTYGLINSIDPGIYIQFATENKYHDDIFFSKEIDGKTKIYDTINQTLGNKDVDRINNKQALYAYLLKNKKLLFNQISKNESYMKYLQENNLGLNDLFLYIERMTNLDQTLLNGCFYLVALLEILLFYFVFHYRIRIYLIAAVLYTFSNLNIFTLGIFGNMFYPLSKAYFSLMQNDFKYENYTIILNSFVPTFKEALMTYIIIDAIGQYYKDKNGRHISYHIKTIYYSIPIVLKELKFIDKTNPSICVKKVKIEFSYLLSYCKRNKRDIYLQEITKLLEENRETLIQHSTSMNIKLMIELIEKIQSKMKSSSKINQLIKS